MSQSITGGMTLTGTGNQSYTGLPFLPDRMELIFSQKGSGSDTTRRFSRGRADLNSQRVDGIYDDNTNKKSYKSTSKMASHYDVVTGVFTEVINASLVSFDNNGGGDYGVTLNQTAATANFQGDVTFIQD